MPKSQANRKPGMQFIRGVDPARVVTPDLVFAKADGDIEAGLEMLGELGGSHIRLIFAYDSRTADRLEASILA